MLVLCFSLNISFAKSWAYSAYISDIQPARDFFFLVHTGVLSLWALSEKSRRTISPRSLVSPDTCFLISINIYFHFMLHSTSHLFHFPLVKIHRVKALKQIGSTCFRVQRHILGCTPPTHTHTLWARHAE